MDRRALLKWLGVGTASVAVPGSTYALGRHQGSSNLSGHYTESVLAGQRRGHVSTWWSVDTDHKTLALTFDDGPTEQFTAEVLDVLARYEVPASFFLIGALVERHPDLVRQMLEGGHEVANHTFDHYSSAIQSRSETFATVERGADAIAAISGDRPRWFRPVKGHVTGDLLAAAADVGHDLAMWSVSRDPGLGTAIDDADGVLANYVADVHEGAIVIFHDGIGRSAFDWTGPDDDLMRARRCEIDVLPRVIERYLADGYEFTTISHLIDEYGPTH